MNHDLALDNSGDLGGDDRRIGRVCGLPNLDLATPANVNRDVPVRRSRLVHGKVQFHTLHQGKRRDYPTVLQYLLGLTVKDRANPSMDKFNVVGSRFVHSDLALSDCEG